MVIVGGTRHLATVISVRGHVTADGLSDAEIGNLLLPVVDSVADALHDFADAAPLGLTVESRGLRTRHRSKR